MIRKVRFKGALGEDTSDECTSDNGDIYIVESIKAHRVDKNGKTEYKVKWADYEACTWEPEGNLTIPGNQILEEYHNEPSKSGENFENSVTPAQTKRITERISKITKRQGPVNMGNWIPLGSWDGYISSIDGCEIVEDKWTIYVTWKTGQRTKHDKKTIYKRCPQTMLQYFESHIIKH